MKNVAACEVMVWPIWLNFFFQELTTDVFHWLQCADVDIFTTCLGLKSYTLCLINCLYSILAPKISLVFLSPSL